MNVEKAQTFTCYDCEDYAHCEQSILNIVLFNCDTHRFVALEPVINREGVITALRWRCEHCRLPLTLEPPNMREGIMLHGLLA